MTKDAINFLLICICFFKFCGAEELKFNSKHESGELINSLDFNPVSLKCEEDLSNLLSSFQINTDNWIKSVSALYKEVKNGECILGIEGGKLHCHVNGVVIKCFHTNCLGERFQLFEEKQVFKNEQTRMRGHKFVAEKLKSGESPEQGALRGLAEELQISGPDVNVVPLFEENKSETIESPDYRGIQTSYNTYVFSFEVSDSHYKNFYIEDQEDKQTFFSWIKIN